MAKGKGGRKAGSKPSTVASRKGGKPRQRTGNAAPRPSRNAARKSSGVTSSVHPYTKLILDPCEAKLTSAPLPGRFGAQAIRLPIRMVLTVPSASTGLTGGGNSGGVCSAIVATLAPHAIAPSGPPPIVIQGLPSENSPTLINYPAGESSSSLITNFATASPSGLTQLWGISSEVRPIAACLKLGYIGSQGNNSGNFIAYEGGVNTLFGKAANGNNNGFAPDVAGFLGLQTPLSTLALDSWTTTDTTRPVESRANIAAADAYWQTFRNVSTQVPPGPQAYVRGVGVTDSVSLCDPDISSAPVACVAVSGAVPGSQYLLTGAVVYEWSPAVTLGMPAPQRTLRDPLVLQKVVGQLAKYGRMLVGTVVDSGVSPPGLMIDLAMKAFSSMALSRANRPGPLRIGM